MKPTENWLIKIGAIASPEGWRHPKTNELLKCQKLDIKKANVKTSVNKSNKSKNKKVTDENTDRNKTVAKRETKKV